MQLLKAIRGDQSFQVDKPNLKNANGKKSFSSVQSRGDESQSRNRGTKGKMDVSADRSLDMFNSEFNSVAG